MKIGDIVRTGDSPITRVTEIIEGFETVKRVALDPSVNAWNYDWRQVTVSELFREAGYPVPEDAKIVQMFSAIGALSGAEFVLGDQVCRDWYEFKSRQTPDGAEWRWTHNGSRDVAHAIDLSRLPAADAWDCLPKVVKAVVR